MNSTENKWIMVTGATGSIGKALVTEISKKGYHVILACRNAAKAQKIVDELTQFVSPDLFKICIIDFEDSKSVYACANKLKAENIKLQALINNAGVMGGKYVDSEFGSQTFTVNYMSTVMLTRLLLPLIVDGGRITFTTSITRFIVKVSNDFFSEEPKKFNQFISYGKTKLAITWYALFLAEICAPRHILVNCADPGIVDSNMITMHKWFDPLTNLLFRPIIHTPMQGAYPSLKIALSPITESAYIFTGKSMKKIIVKSNDTFQYHWLICSTNNLITDCISDMDD